MPFKILTSFLIYTLISEIVARIFALTIRNSCPVYHVFVLANYLFYAAIFYHLFKGPIIRKIVLWSMVLFICFWLINLIFLQHSMEFPTFSLTVCCVLFMTYSLKLFLQMLETPTEIAIFKQNIFWFNIAVLFYSVTLVAFLSIHTYMVKHQIDTGPLDIIVDIITDFNYALLGYTVIADKRRFAKIA